MKYLIMFLLVACASEPTKTKITTMTTYYPPPAPIIKYVEVPVYQNETDFDTEMMMWDIDDEIENEIEANAAASEPIVQYESSENYENFQGFDEPAPYIGEDDE